MKQRARCSSSHQPPKPLSPELDRRYHASVNALAKPAPVAPRRFEALDSLRGVCAILVVMFHMPVASHWRTWDFIQHAYLFVDYFFVLSGFVIAHAYAERLKTGADAGRFMVRRFGRIWPMHVLMLAAYVGLVLVAPKRFRWIGLVLAIIGGVLVVSYARRWMNTTYDFAVPRAVYGFFLGCLLQGLWMNIPRLKGLAATGLEIAAVVAVCLFVAWAEGPVTVAVTLVFVILVWVFAGEEGRVSRLLDHPALVTLGRWSFSIYMVHMFILTVMLIIARKLDWMPGGRRVDFGSVWLNDLFALGLFGFIVVIAVVAHNRVERPAQRLIDRWTKPKAA